MEQYGQIRQILLSDSLTIAREAATTCEMALSHRNTIPGLSWSLVSDNTVP
jgi:hypothetical protein